MKEPYELIYNEQTEFGEIEPYITFNIKLKNFISIFSKRELFLSSHEKIIEPSEVENLETILFNLLTNQ